MSIFLTRLTTLGLALLMSTFCGVSFGLSRKGGEMPLDRLTKQSDDIVIGQVKAKNVNVVGRHFETDYEVEVGETLKGKSYKSGQRFTVTIMGGELTSPPLSQYIQGMPVMYQGEDVALFLNHRPLQNPAGKAPKVEANSKMLTTPRVVGWKQGKFSIVTDKVDGSRKIMRLDTELFNMIPQDMIVKETLGLVSKRQLRVTSGTVVSQKSSAVSGREALEQTQNAQNFDRSGNTAKLANSINTAGGLVVQDLNDFKNQVTTIVTKETGR